MEKATVSGNDDRVYKEFWRAHREWVAQNPDLHWRCYTRCTKYYRGKEPTQIIRGYKKIERLCMWLIDNSWGPSRALFLLATRLQALFLPYCHAAAAQKARRRQQVWSSRRRSRIKHLPR